MNVASKRKKAEKAATQPARPKYSGPLHFHILQNLKTAQEFRIEKDMNESFLSKLFGNMR